ncbi:endonuclease/exonuclease/phosphatase family protein-like protein [Plenodomus tracheiphilus IPT5]|uniref:Endonuclease/exonuclease/phosphatase family protein-like protein n=1 Tax=Plenodomus tracheiphilus IPT5 TaxID=1408161 RepID=A0A6A7B0N9_9PLEO|nr:endonuclease/exonuclease/phosphatase family protein-like protein [Plenodomus tracheiphilus IPT5]
MRSTLILSLSTSIGHAVAQASGTFNTLTFNVAGLPAVLNGNDVPGDKTTNTARIGQLFARYNISLIHVQEDFNYHATLYANDNHPFRTPTSGGVPFGSGLNSLSNYEYAAFERVKWNQCSNIDSADCLTPKGFTFMRVKFAEGIWIDAYNLHADAGTTTADNAARASNLRQVSDYIKIHSTGNPIIVFGDSNSRYTRTDDIPFIFKNENGMTDAWVQLVRNGNPPAPGAAALLCDNPSPNATCEIVDKTWYRGSSAVTLQAKSFKYAGEMFLQDDGNVLSDHNGVLVDFAWSQSARLRVSDTFGGEFGNWYNDLDIVAGVGSPTVASVTLRGADRVDAVSLTLASGQKLSHGGTGGTDSTLTLNAGETLTGSTLCRGDKDNKTRIFYAEMTTSAGRKVTKGVKTSDCVTSSAGNGWSIVGFLGRGGDEIDQVGFVYSKA